MQLAYARYKAIDKNEKHEECEEPIICYVGEDPGFAISVSYICLRLIWHIHLSIVLRQHWVNKRKGMGDAKQKKNS